ncbi:MAG: DUF835 domain-containing protein [Methanomassiliicoccus sp.]|nr:DUF835 domain-containing protein [Methanomassiliicoccus sp.]
MNGSKISLLIEDYPRNGYQLYSKMVGRSTSGLCITRLHPDYVAQKYGLEMSKRYWLSGQSGDDVIAPKALNQLLKVIRTELRGRSGGTIFLDGLEYLLLFNDMNKVLGILEQIDSLLKDAKVELIVAMDPLTFEQKDLDTLWAAFPHYTAEEIKAKVSGEGPAVAARTANAPQKASLRV